MTIQVKAKIYADFKVWLFLESARIQKVYLITASATLSNLYH